MLKKGFDLRATVEIINIEDRIPREHLLRKIDAAVDFSHIYDMVWEKYSADKGQKSVDPAGIITSKLSNMSDHVDTTFTQVTDDIVKKGNP